MLKLPIDRINKYIESLGGDVIECSRSIMFPDYFHPFIVCVIEPSKNAYRVRPGNPSNTIYEIVLIDLIKCCKVGLGLVIEGIVYEGSDGSKYLLGKGNRIKPFYSQHAGNKKGSYIVNKTIELYEFIWSYARLIKDGEGNDYQKWIINYINKLQVLQELIGPCNIPVDEELFYGNEEYVRDLERVESKVMKDLDLMWSAYLDVNKEGE